MKSPGTRFGVVVVLAALVLIGMLVGSSPKPGDDPEAQAPARSGGAPAASDEEAVLAALRASIQAFNDSDFAAYKDGFDPESPDRDLTIGLAENLFRTYRFRVTVDRAEVEKIEGGLATVRAVQTTRRVSGPPFRDETVEVVHTFRRHEGRWLLRTTDVEKTMYLDGRTADPPGSSGPPAPAPGRPEHP